MRYLLFILLVLVACKKKKEDKPSNNNTTGAVITPTVNPGPVDTIKRVVKTLEFILDYNCDYKGYVNVYLDDSANQNPYDSTFNYQTTKPLTVRRTTKLRYLSYNFISYQAMQDVNGHLPCTTTNFTLTIDGIVVKTYSATSKGNQSIDLYK